MSDCDGLIKVDFNERERERENDKIKKEGDVSTVAAK
jgi:hypothetical protein